MLEQSLAAASKETPSAQAVDALGRKVDTLGQAAASNSDALGKLQERGRLFVKPGDRVYEGMVIGIHSRDNDLAVNPVKAKQLTNFRTVLKDDAILLTPPIALTLEYAVEFIADDELLEITPKSIRVRKRHLKELDRKRAARSVEREPLAAAEQRAL